MGAVNGASLFVAPSDVQQAVELMDHLPAGVTTLPPLASGAACSLQEVLADRPFDVLLLVAADTIGASPRLLTTALSAVRSRELVAGCTPHGTLYLAGAAQSQSGRAVELLETITESMFAPGEGLRMERRTRLTALDGPDDLEPLLETHRAVVPRLSHALSALTVRPRSS
jgi:hypothetical protein